MPWRKSTFGLPLEDAPHRVGDVGGVEAGGGHLVEQRLERVEVVAVDDGDVDVGVGELLRGSETTEPGADDDDPLALAAHAPSATMRGWQVGHQ